MFNECDDKNLKEAMKRDGIKGFIQKRKQEEINKKLVQAVESNNIEAIKSLLKEGADPNQTLSNGTAPLIWFAAKMGNNEMFDLLLEQPDLKLDE